MSGRLASVAFGARTVLYGRDGAGAVTSIGGEDDITTVGYDYDSFGRVTQVSDSALGKSIAYDYDNRGLRDDMVVFDTATPANVHMSVDYEFDEAGRLATVTRGSDPAAVYTYDGAGRRSTLTLPNGVVTTYTYTGNDQLLDLTTANAGGDIAKFTYALDATGNRDEITYLGGSRSVYTFDEAYRLEGETRYADATTDNMIYEQTFEYDQVGNRTRMTGKRVVPYRADSDTLGLWHMEEDFDDGVLTIADASGHLNPLEGSSNIAKVDGRYGKAVDFAGGCLAALDDIDGYLEVDGNNFTLEAWIKADEFVGDSGIMGKWDDMDDNRSYKLYVDSSAKLNLLLSSDGTATTVVTLTGNTDVPTEEWVHVAAVRELDQIRLYVNEVEQTATGAFAGAVHDGTASLLVGDGFDGAIDEVQISKADRSGSLNEVDVRCAYNERNQLTSEASEASGTSVKTYSYDKNGNTTDIVEAVDLNDDGVGDVGVSSVQMEYDQLNRMLSYEGPEGTESFSYRGAEWHRFSADGTRFLYDGDNVAADVEGGAVTRTYVTPFLDQNLSMTVHGATQATYYYSQDGLGSVRTLTDSSGTVENRYDYAPFGGRYQASTGAGMIVDQRYTYTGRENNHTGPSLYYRYRQYDPIVGRFEGRDPIYESGGSPNYYEYVMGSPIGWIDPPGLARVKMPDTGPYPCLLVFIKYGSGNPYARKPGSTYPNRFAPVHAVPGVRTGADASTNMEGHVNAAGEYDDADKGVLFECCCLTDAERQEVDRRMSISNWNLEPQESQADPARNPELPRNPWGCGNRTSWCANGAGGMPIMPQMPTDQFLTDFEEEAGYRPDRSTLNFFATPIVMENHMKENTKCHEVYRNTTSP